MYVRDFQEIKTSEYKRAGGKGASLAKMTSNNFNVPPGFILLSDAFDNFLDKYKIRRGIEKLVLKVDSEDINKTNKISEQIRDLIEGQPLPEDISGDIKKKFKKLNAKHVAIRSSATAEDSSEASFAGELESFLNTDEKSLIKNVKKCWSSLFTPRALVYQKEKGLLGRKASVGVVIQKMIQSDVSGISFTTHPMKDDSNQIVIEAGFGLGEAIVSGSITPDNYVVDKNDFSLVATTISRQDEMIVWSKEGNVIKKIKDEISSKQKMPGRQIIELAKICQEIERYYGFPCDIEWAIENDKIYITQSRPITTLN